MRTVATVLICAGVVLVAALALRAVRAPEAKQAPPEHAIGERTNSFADGYFAVIKRIGATDYYDEGSIRSNYRIADVPLREPLEPGWEFCDRKEALNFLFKIEGFEMYSSTMFRVLPEEGT